ncbi:MAG: PfkB family carbohydrate kinase, partial [Gammaproteobacteria bacterium]
EDAGVKTAFTLSDPNMVKFFKDGLLEMIGGGVDLLFANEAEALGLAGGDDLNGAIEALKPLAREFVITRGPEGALIYSGGEIIEVAGVKTDAVDTVGAGDMFAGAFLYGYTHHWDYAKAGKLAATAAARLVSQYGPRMSNEQVQDVLHQCL